MSKENNIIKIDSLKKLDNKKKKNDNYQDNSSLHHLIAVEEIINHFLIEEKNCLIIKTHILKATFCERLFSELKKTPYCQNIEEKNEKIINHFLTEQENCLIIKTHILKATFCEQFLKVTIEKINLRSLMECHPISKNSNSFPKYEDEIVIYLKSREFELPSFIIIKL
jgi:hypothetical protein